MPPLEEERAGVLGEFGGLGLPVEGHLWWDKRNWGYRNLNDLAELQGSYDALIDNLRPMIARGLCAAVYTQTSDVEGEVNGLLTYDREVVKFDVNQMAKLHKPLYEPPPFIITKVLAPTSENRQQIWHYTTDEPGEGWQQPDFDDSAWQEGTGGFGTKGTPGAVLGTEWKTSDIWLRRDFEWKDMDLNAVHLRIHHDEDVEVFLNGRQIAAYEGYLTAYAERPLDKQTIGLLKSGRNTLAVHCRQTGGGQFVDVGLIDVLEKPRPSD
jgi:hypothetical protein